jgi:hypothetical protein
MEFVYTRYGYGKVLETSDTRVKVELTWNAIAYLPPESISRTVRIFVKTFIGDRRTLEYDFDCNEVIESLR